MEILEHSRWGLLMVLSSEGKKVKRRIIWPTVGYILSVGENFRIAGEKFVGEEGSIYCLHVQGFVAWLGNNGT
jgi:hypothetical protein